MVLFTACAQMPVGARELDDEQRRDVEELIEHSESVTLMVSDVLEVADPLFDLEGHPTQNNAILQDGIIKVLYEIQDIWEADRIVVMPLDDFSVAHTQASAHGIISEVELDDYIVLGMNEQGVISNSPGQLMHEGTHFFFGRHEASLEYALQENLETQEMDATQLLDLFVAEGDVAYTVGSLYDLFESLPFYARRFTDIVDETRTTIDNMEGLNTQMTQEHAQQYSQMLLDWQTREGWVNALVSNGFYASVRDRLDVLGVTSEEFTQVMQEQDELFEAHQDSIAEALVLWRETFPEYSQEVKSKAHQEIRRGRK